MLNQLGPGMIRQIKSAQVHTDIFSILRASWVLAQKSVSGQNSTSSFQNYWKSFLSSSFTKV